MPTEWVAGVADAVQRWMNLYHGSVDSAWCGLGRAMPGGEPGWLALSVPDVVAQPLWLAGPGGPDDGPAFLVDEVRSVDGGLLLRPPAGLPPDVREVWALPVSRRMLVEALLAGLRAVGSVPLATALAKRRLAGAPDPTLPHPAGLSTEQAAAYRACLTPGLRLVWGPAGPATSVVLGRAIADLAGAGRRVLLVGTTDRAVDAALHEAVSVLAPGSGVAVRVGPAQLDAVATDPAVALDLLTAAETAGDDRRRAAIARRLTTIADREPEMAALSVALDGYDDDAYRGAAARIAAERELAELEQRLRAAASVLRAAHGAHAVALEEQRAVEREVAGRESAGAAVTRIDELTEELRALERDLRRCRTELTMAQVWAWGGTGWLDRLRREREAKAAAAALARAEREAGPRRSKLQWELMEARSAAGPVTRSALGELERGLADACAATESAAAELARAQAYSDELERLADAARRRGLPSAADHALVGAAERRRLPAGYERLLRLRRQQHAAAEDLGRLAAEHRALADRASARRAAAGRRIVASASVVATTLVRSRLLELDPESFDVVLVAGAHAASLAEVLLAVGQARTTAVLVGDFQQPGPVLDEPVGAAAATDAMLAAWVGSTCFAHLGVDTPEAAVDADGCTAMLRAFRAATPAWTAARTS